MCCVLWKVCQGLQARVEALERKGKGRGRGERAPHPGDGTPDIGLAEK